MQLRLMSKDGKQLLERPEARALMASTAMSLALIALNISGTFVFKKSYSETHDLFWS